MSDSTGFNQADDASGAPADPYDPYKFEVGDRIELDFPSLVGGVRMEGLENAAHRSGCERITLRETR